MYNSNKINIIKISFLKSSDFIKKIEKVNRVCCFEGWPN